MGSVSVLVIGCQIWQLLGMALLGLLALCSGGNKPDSVGFGGCQVWQLLRSAEWSQGCLS